MKIQVILPSYYQNNMSRATPPFKAKYFWIVAQIPYFPSTVGGGARGGLTSVRRQSDGSPI
ncbi:MAG: hypothetical protein F6K23_12450 [Okeania sp. SIO2C9]|uniref:hypothetical protein n=1 Tax=Okeania sp. SIO2C9 TaxID=2607791 RepID=UPI0013C24F6F|nr:hypothetical protein [Okeania sp. SIO2C9]NEQ73787.1 hypothetical protein [Okeania sp. SIO2C9]